MKRQLALKVSGGRLMDNRPLTIDTSPTKREHLSIFSKMTAGISAAPG
jgi:hypothetical protein